MNISEPSSASDALPPTFSQSFPDAPSDPPRADEALSPEALSLTSSTRFSLAHGKTLILLTLSALVLGEANIFRINGVDYLLMGLLLAGVVFCTLGLFFLGSDAPLSNGARAGLSLWNGQTRLALSLKRLATLHPLLLTFWIYVLLWEVVNLVVSFRNLLAQVQVTSVWPLVVLSVGVAVGVVWSLRSPRGWWLQLAVFVGLGWWYLSRDSTGNDVYIFQNDACAAFLRGINPYTITFPNMYYHEHHSDFSAYYGTGLSVNGRLQFGYVYMPLTLLLTLPGYLLGDSRLSQLFAIAISACLLMGSRPRGEKALIGALFLWMPMVFYVMFLSWTDPFCVLTLSFVFFCTRRRLPWLPIACGLFLVSKQYALLALPLLWLLAPLTAAGYVVGATSTRLTAREHWALFWPFLGKTVAVAAVVTLPLALWNFKAFLWSTMLLQFYQPYRPDSLSFMAMWGNLGWGRWPAWLPFAITGAALVWALRRAPRDEVGFFTAVAFVFLVFFALSKQAFVNYYYFVIGALWCATVALFEQSRAQIAQRENSQRGNLSGEGLSGDDAALAAEI